MAIALTATDEDLRKLIRMKFAAKDKVAQPGAIEVVMNRLTEFDLDELVDRVCTLTKDIIVTQEVVLEALNSLQKRGGKREEKLERKEVQKKEIEVYVTPAEVRIIKSYNNVGCKGNVGDFLAYFRSRYNKLSRLLRNRINSQPISVVVKRNRWALDKVELVGMVTSVRETPSGNAVIELEDPTGRITVIARDKLKDVAMELLGDEVVGITGTYRNGCVLADRIILPDIPVKEQKKANGAGIVFISDTHFGSNTFLEDAWDRFVGWLNGEGGEKAAALAEKIRYIFVAGDIVDGVGVYPDQEKELAVHDIYEQYEVAAAQFDKIPKRIKIILSPGNHDAVRQAEPQPPLPKEYASLFSNNVVHVSNPSMVDVGGLKVMMYHGRSLDEFMLRIPRLDYSRPAEAMVEYLRRRVFTPAFGSKSVHVAPLEEDYLVIDELPDVLHCGHVHTYGTAVYRGVLLVNSSTFQAQTEYQKKLNFNPTPGIVAVYVNGKMHKLKFCV